MTEEEEEELSDKDKINIDNIFSEGIEKLNKMDDDIGDSDVTVRMKLICEIVMAFAKMVAENNLNPAEKIVLLNIINKVNDVVEEEMINNFRLG